MKVKSNQLFADMYAQLTEPQRSKASQRILWDFCRFLEENYPAVDFFDVTKDMVQEHLEDCLLEAAQLNNAGQYLFVGKRKDVLNKIFHEDLSWEKLNRPIFV